MRRLALLFGIVAALAGPMLRQAEAADDLARALCEWLAPQALESCDGGVGDEPEITTARLDAPTLAGCRAEAELQAEPILPREPLCPRLVLSLHHGPHPVITRHQERLSWLQMLLV